VPLVLKVAQVLVVKSRTLVHQRKVRLLLVELKVGQVLVVKSRKLVHRRKVRLPLVSTPILWS
jgi:hypothetical protein